MPGPVPITRLPQPAPTREAHWYDPAFNALSFLDTSDLSDSEDPMRSMPSPTPYVSPRRTTDIQLGGEADGAALPTIPNAPKMFDAPDPSIALRGLESARTDAMNGPDNEIARIKSLMSYDQDAIREDVPDFLQRGNDRRAAEDAQNAIYAKNAMFGGETAHEAVANDARFRGLQEARDMQNPAYRRKRRQEDALAQAELYGDPRMVARRKQELEERLTEKGSLAALAVKMGLDPDALTLDDREHRQALELAMARNQLGGMFGTPGMGGQGGGRAMTEQEIRAELQGKGEDEIQETIAEFKAHGLLR